MAIAFRIAGTAIGSYLGGPIGGMIGGMIGGLIGDAIFGDDEKPVVHGRIQDLTIQSPDYGSPIAVAWGTIVTPARFIDSGPQLKETTHDVEAGKGFGGGPTAQTVTYSFDGAFILTSNEIVALLRLWGDTKLIRDVRGQSLEAIIASGSEVTGGGRLRIFYGTEDQLPDALLEQIHGAGQVPAYRGHAGFIADNFQLANFGNRVPNFSGEVATVGANQLQNFGDLYPPVGVNWKSWLGWGYVDDNGEIVALLADGNFQAQASASYQRDNAYNWWRLTSEGIFPEEKLRVTNSPLNSAIPLISGGGHSDEPATLVWASGLGDFYLFLYNRGIVLTFDPGAIPAYSNAKASLWVFQSGRLLVYFGYGWGGSYQELAMFGELGALLAHSFSLVGKTVVDLGASANYAYALSSQYLNWTSPPPWESYLIKLDPETLDIIEEIPLGGQFAGMSVIADDEIYFARGNTFSSWNGSVATEIGTLAGGTFSPYVAMHLVYKSGVFYYGVANGRVHRIALTALGDCVSLSVIVADICANKGLRQSQYDVSELTDCVPGFAIPRRSDGVVNLGPLQSAYYFDAVESDGQIKFRKRGRASSAALLQADMAAHEPQGDEPDPIVLTLTNERELPQRFEVTYVQKDKDYEEGNQYDERLTTESRRNITEELPIALDNSKALQVAKVRMAEAWTGRSKVEFSLSRKWARLEPTDTVEVEVEP